MEKQNHTSGTLELVVPSHMRTFYSLIFDPILRCHYQAYVGQGLGQNQSDH